jgi:hypothetical protein
MPPLQLAGSELNSTLRLSIQWGPGPCKNLCLLSTAIFTKTIDVQISYRFDAKSNKSYF